MQVLFDFFFGVFIFHNDMSNVCWWAISPRGYHPPSSQCSDTDMVY